MDAYENFKGVFDKFIAEGICIYYAGNFFCTIAFDFIREDEQWDKFLPYMPHHEEAAFDKPVRDQIKARRPLKYCRDVYEKIDVTALKAEATIDERQARAELVIIKTYIEQKAWNTFGTKTSTITLADRSSKIVPSALKPIHDALVQNNASPITLLLLIKQRFQQRYFAQANCKNTELLAFFRSFYTNNHITYMQENLHPPEQQPNLNTIPLMEIN